MSQQKPTIWDQFGTDEELEKNGVVCEYAGGFRVLVARAGGANQAYKSRIEKFGRKFQRQIQTDSLEEGVVLQQLKAIFADTIVRGWENGVDENGNPLEFNRANCMKLFEAMPDFFFDIRRQAEAINNYRRGEEEEDAKN